MPLRPNHLNPYAGAPRKPNGQNPFLGVLDGVVKQVETSQISFETQQEMIAHAEYYAKRNGLSCTSDMAGVMKMMAHADKQHRLHMEALHARERGDYRPVLTGYDRVTGFEA